MVLANHFTSRSPRAATRGSSARSSATDPAQHLVLVEALLVSSTTHVELLPDNFNHPAELAHRRSRRASRRAA